MSPRPIIGPDGRQVDWDLSDEDVAEVMAASFGTEQPSKGDSDMPSDRVTDLPIDYLAGPTGRLSLTERVVRTHAKKYAPLPWDSADSRLFADVAVAVFRAFGKVNLPSLYDEFLRQRDGEEGKTRGG